MTDAARRVDAHHHLWDLDVRDQPWTIDLPALRRTFDMYELGPKLAKARIDGTVLVQTICVPEETPEFLALAAADDFVLGVVGWVDLTGPAVADRLAELAALPGGQYLVGVRHQVQGEPDPRWLLRPDVRAGLRAVADAGLVYDLLVTPEQLPAAVETVRDLPHLRFVLDHGGKPRIGDGELDPWRAMISGLAVHENAAVKLSGLLTEARPEWALDDLRPFAEHLVDSFSAERVMFGSDWPVSILRAGYEDVVAITETLVEHCTPYERQQIFGGTAQRWYRLGGGR